MNVVVGERAFAYVCSCVGVSLWYEYLCVCAREKERDGEELGGVNRKVH